MLGNNSGDPLKTIEKRLRIVGTPVNTIRNRLNLEII